MLEARDIHLAGRLAGVSACIAPGQLTAICGPNGAGKSTLLAALAGLVAPQDGKVLLHDQPLAALPRQVRARTLGYLPQQASVAWDLSVRTLVALGRLPYASGAAEDARAVATALSTMMLEELAERPVSTLSGGELARAHLARVLAGEPRWILADEPLAGLDLAHQTSLLAHLRDLADGGQAVVLVMHDLAAAMNWADRVIVLHCGRVVADDAPDVALAGDVLAAVWQVKAEWMGQPGARALGLRRQT
ncbi:ABC transporter ATP-binding protein [Alteraurantiacibacter buctensis]|uniref:ATP-binding cassette domain-containing protein n=1 Tax=Alteraurantiacibacter buctensis TaxID=1503981 RepID=A0A844YZJ0_9SPHN|nr:ATP-binding cassette domain-containing protein [Alteraurantiacibacter buctensis]MXO71884.1 ATP-binding cassette domain-containing protein [Alteraurantiacibacter buctensis]